MKKLCVVLLILSVAPLFGATTAEQKMKAWETIGGGGNTNGYIYTQQHRVSTDGQLYLYLEDRSGTPRADWVAEINAITDEQVEQVKAAIQQARITAEQLDLEQRFVRLVHREFGLEPPYSQAQASASRTAIKSRIETLRGQVEGAADFATMKAAQSSLNRCTAMQALYTQLLTEFPDTFDLTRSGFGEGWNTP